MLSRLLDRYLLKVLFTSLVMTPSIGSERREGYPKGGN